jgi:glycosyltransferase involved in cell wall biosynthesis
MTQSTPLAPNSWADRKSTLGRRPKLLFLARAFPPLRATGCVRTWNVAKHLSRLGWEVTVVTPHPSVWRHVDNPRETDVTLKQHGIRRILTGHHRRMLLPSHFNGWHQGWGWFVGGTCRKIARYLNIDSGVGWIKAAEQACATLTATDVDVILATGSPFASFKLARRLSNRLGRPYVLDYRDPWTGNPHEPRPPRPRVVQEEATLLANAEAVTIVSPSWGSALDDRFSLGAKLHVITNGYDPEELATVNPHKFGHVAIVYAGNFYPPKRVISPLMAALKRLEGVMHGKENTWFFHYYGKQENHVCQEARRFGVMERVVLHGTVPRSEALSAVHGAGVAVVITSVADVITKADQGILPGKVFETLGLGTPILLIAPPSSDIETLIETTASGCRFAGSDIDAMTAFLAEAITGQVRESKDCEGYAWPNLVTRMNTVLREAMRSA